MATYPNFSGLTFTAEQVRQISEILMLEYLTAPDNGIARFHNVFTGIASDKKIGFIGEMGMVGKASRGCSPADDTADIPTSEKTWEPKEFDVRLAFCYKDLESTLAVYAMKNGVEVADLTDTDYMRLVEEKFGEAVQKMLWRLAWFGDSSAANFSDSPAGYITDSINLTYMNIVDGFWKQIFAIGAADSDRVELIASNNEASYALQKSALTPALAKQYFENLIYNASDELRARQDGVILSTRSLTDKYAQYLKGTGIQVMYENLVNGVRALSIDGVQIIELPIWDNLIKTVHDSGVNYFKPHRAVYTTLENLGLGVKATNQFANFDIFYDKDSRKTKIDLIDKMDAKIIQNSLIQTCY